MRIRFQEDRYCQKKRMLAIMMSALMAAGICSSVTVCADADSKTLTVGFDQSIRLLVIWMKVANMLVLTWMWALGYVIILDGSL